MITSPTVWGALNDRAGVGIFDVQGSGAPTSGASGTGVGILGPGSSYTDSVTGFNYRQVGTLASPTWTRSTLIATASTVASATTIAPTTSVVHVSGTVAIATITAPAADFVGSIMLIPTGIFTTTTAGNIGLASTAVVGKVLHMTYDGTSWYPSY